jgi:enamine deaminase RidA (YjgF/YER057c/UK114 family)
MTLLAGSWDILGSNSKSHHQEISMFKLRLAAMAAVVFGVSYAAQAQVEVKHLQPNPKAAIASGVWAGDTLYLSGQLADPVTPADAAKGTPAVYGDTEQQAFSELTKIQALLKEQGLDMKDVVKMTVFMAGDPAKGGKLDFAGMMASYTKFFGTKEQPNKPARSAMQVAALAAPWALLEIEVIAVRSK